VIGPTDATGGPGAGRIAIVSLDLLGLTGRAVGGWERFKGRIAAVAGTGIRPADVVLACTHTHTGPDSVALTDLYLTPAFKAWVDALADLIGAAVGTASGSAVPCRLHYGTTHAPGLSIYRRIKTTDGILLSHPPPPDDIVISRDGPVDDTVNVFWFKDADDRVRATVVNATCHPVHEMCEPVVSPDYPGAAAQAIEAAHPGAVALFLNGAAGNINPPTVSGGAGESARHGRTLAGAVCALLDAGSGAPAAVAAGAFTLLRSSVPLPTRTAEGAVDGPPITAELVGVRAGSAALLFLPGEPFVETGLALRKASPFELTAVVGYAESSVGYVPTDAAFAEGGYETTFGPWSVVAPGSEPVLRREAAALLRALHGPDVALTRRDHRDSAAVTNAVNA
jgi:hypothetical protein